MLTKTKPIITVVGKRTAPADILAYVATHSLELRSMGVLVRTGDARSGVDHAVRYPALYAKSLSDAQRALAGGADNLEVFTPRDAKGDAEAMALAKRYHGNWGVLTPIAQLLHARNAYQIAGLGLNNPSDALLCYTVDGCECHRDRTKLTGGTGTAISIAEVMYKIPVFNMQRGISRGDTYRGFLTTLLLRK